MRILLADGDEKAGSAMQLALCRSGYATDWVQSGSHMRNALSLQRYDCAVLGWPVPELPRDAVMPALRRTPDPLPVALVMDVRDVDDRIALIDQGVDDCLVRPFCHEELVARLRALMRRAAHMAAGPADDGLTYGSLTLHPRRLSATWAQREVKLTQCEFAVLETFMRKKSQILSRGQLEESLYGWGDEVSSNAVEVYVHHLRRKFHPGLIRTVRGMGYQLGADPA
jgi:DNA-binding response OmpR family regulator